MIYFPYVTCAGSETGEKLDDENIRFKLSLFNSWA